MKKYIVVKSVFVFFLSLSISLFSSTSIYAGKHSFSPTLPQNISIYGGSYSAIKNQTYDHTKFEVHHLISRSALCLFANYVFKNYGKTPQNSFLEGKQQGWAPSILLTKEDHLKTLSRSTPGYDFSMLYISKQATQIIESGAFLEMLKNEIAYIQKYINVDGKYNEGIRQVCNYIKTMSIRLYKNKLSFYPLGIQRKGLQFIYKLPKHDIFESSELPDSFIDELHVPVDSATQTSLDYDHINMDASTQTGLDFPK